MKTNNNFRKQSFAALSLAALGVVYGDIGTSPLYALKEVFNPNNGLTLNQANLIGVLSLIFWSLMVVVSLKYVTLILRADNRGEGGIMALLALASSSVANRPGLRNTLLLAGAFGAALFYGDAVLTPAISVLSAIEGMEIATPLLKPYIVPLTIWVLIVLFIAQRKGTAGIGMVFGPVVVAWFIALAVVGVLNIVKAPQILAALNPFEGFKFLFSHGWIAFVSLGAIVLALTGAEALYADLGHFGRVPIRTAWFAVVLPSLVLNYFGQGALLLTNPKALENPFYLMFPAWALYPMVALATAATVIASQATISGAYSMTKQAMQLGFLPRMGVTHTSAKEIGQIYIPMINWFLLIVIIAVVLSFGSSSKLASAYGVAVTGTMLITTLLTFFVLRYSWGYNWILCIVATVLFFAVDALFFSANLLKIAQGGWFPLVIGLLIFTLMITWKRGREILRSRMRTQAIDLRSFLDSLFADPPVRVWGTAVFMIADPNSVPNALLHNLAHNKVLHERLVFMTVVMKEVPWVRFGERTTVESLGKNCYRITINYGFKNDIDIPKALQLCSIEGLEFNMLETSFFLGRETIIPVPGDGMALWREKLFASMSRNAGNAAEYFGLPPNRVIELGAQVEM